MHRLQGRCPASLPRLQTVLAVGGPFLVLQTLPLPLRLDVLASQSPSAQGQNATSFFPLCPSGSLSHQTQSGTRHMVLSPCCHPRVPGDHPSPELTVAECSLGGKEPTRAGLADSRCRATLCPARSPTERLWPLTSRPPGSLHPRNLSCLPGLPLHQPPLGSSQDSWSLIRESLTIKPN